MRDRYDEKIARLKEVPLFQGLDRRDLERIAQLSTRADVEPGTVLCRQGHSGHEFFVIIAGEARVTIDDKVVNTLGPGDFFGELALLDNGPRVASVTATTPVVALVLSGAEFRALLHDEPRVAVNLLPAIGSHLRALRAA